MCIRDRTYSSHQMQVCSAGIWNLHWTGMIYLRNLVFLLGRPLCPWGPVTGENAGWGFMAFAISPGVICGGKVCKNQKQNRHIKIYRWTSGVIYSVALMYSLLPMTLNEYSTIGADRSFQSLALRSTHDYHHVQRQSFSNFSSSIKSIKNWVTKVS